MNKKLGIHGRYVLYFIAIFSVAIIVLTVIVGARVHDNAKQAAFYLAKESIENYSYFVNNKVEQELSKTLALAELFESAAHEGGDHVSRKRANSHLKYFIENNRQLLGVYTLFEPNAFDGRDQAFANTAGHDDSGRFIPYWTRDAGGQGVLEPLVGYDSKQLGSYYQTPKETGRPTLTEPYRYPAQGKEMLLASISIPIFDKSQQFIGVLGADFSLGELHKLITKKHLFESGTLSVFSRNGTLLADSAVNDKSGGNRQLINNDLLLEKIKEGTNFDLLLEHNVLSNASINDDSQKENMIAFGFPILFGEFENNWMVVAFIPEDELYAHASSTVYEIIVVGFCIFLVISFSAGFAANSLRRHDARFRAVFENSGIGMLVTDRQGNIVSANGVICQLLGYSRDELLEQSIYSLAASEDVDMTHRYFSELVDKRRSTFQIKKRYRCKGGDSRWVRLSLSVFSEEVSPSFFCVAMIEDIEEQKRVELDRKRLKLSLQQSQKMETIGQLTGGIAHDFNNILASILGYTGLALEKVAAEPEGKLAQYLREVYRGGERARDLIAQMLAFSRQQATVPVVFRPAAMIHEVIKLLRPSLPQSIVIKIDVAQEVAAISMDPVHFHQLIMNLCINARDAMQGQGEMRVCINEISVSNLICSSCGQQVEGRFLQISVQDSGEGIKPELLSQIFDPFFTTKVVGKGTGMGLSVVHGIAHEHQGHVVVEHRPGGGCCFNLLFPIVETDQQAMALTVDRTERLRETKEHSILIAEDESVLVRYLSELLAIQGYRVTACINGREALARFQHAPMAYDLLITDQTMPEMSGLELTQAIHRVRPKLPVILCTGFSDSLDEKVALRGGVNRYFQKPVDADELLGAIESCLSAGDGGSQKMAITGT